MIFLRAYATIPEFFNATFGLNLPNIPVNTYGFFVAMGFLAAAIVATKELDRRTKLGLLKGYSKKVEIGSKPKFQDFIFPAIIWFLLGFKIIGAILFNSKLLTQGQETVAYLFSSEGFFITGLVTALLACAYTYYKINQKALPKPEIKELIVQPKDMIGELVGVAAVFGVLGSNVLDVLQPGNDTSLTDLLRDPTQLFSGLTIYGGLLFGIIGILIWANYRKLKPFLLFDSIAIGYILAYGIGRLGCHFSGDGDWGKANLLDKPGFIPQGMWSNTYAHSVISGSPDEAYSWVQIPSCEGKYCMELTQGVWPTSIYEFIMCLAIFGILWSLRKKLTFLPGFIFCLLLIFNGIERYLIEIIRVTKRYESFFNLTQAQIISIMMVIAGIGGIIYLYLNREKVHKRIKNSVSS